MTQTPMAVTYRLDEATRQDKARALKDQLSAAAAAIAATPGLTWKISAIDADRGIGLGLYLFETDRASRNFETGALMQRLRTHPASPTSASPGRRRCGTSRLRWVRPEPSA